VVAVSFVLGGLTSYGQSLLPGSLTSFANSSSGWTLLTAVLVFLARPRPRPAAVLGALSFVALVVGYAAVSTARGFSFNPVF